MDNLRAKIIERATQLKLSSNDLALRCREITESSPDVETIRRYIKGERSLNSSYVSLLCDVLKLKLTRTRN
jgi:hypothetical protein